MVARPAGINTGQPQGAAPTEMDFVEGVPSSAPPEKAG